MQVKTRPLCSLNMMLVPDREDRCMVEGEPGQPLAAAGVLLCDQSLVVQTRPHRAMTSLTLGSQRRAYQVSEI